MTGFRGESCKNMTRNFIKFSYIYRAHDLGGHVFSDNVFGRVTTFSDADRGRVTIFQGAPVGQNTSPPPFVKNDQSLLNWYWLAWRDAVFKHGVASISPMPLFTSVQ